MSDDDPFSKAASGSYTYTDQSGRKLFQVRRRPGKKFAQFHWDGLRWRPGLNGTRQSLYRLPAVASAAAAGAEVWVVEGEKDVHSLEALGVVATTSPGGAGKWKPDYAKTLKGAHVRIVADADEPGYRHAAQVYESVRGVAASVTIAVADEGKDVTDHLEAGHTVDDLIPLSPAELATLAGGAPPTKPPKAAAAGDDEGREVPTVLRDVLGALVLNGGTVIPPTSPSGDWTVNCPTHPDRVPSTTVNVGTDRPVVFCCQAGCTQEAIFDFLVNDCQISRDALMDQPKGPVTDDGSSWEPVDLSAVLAGDDAGDMPTLLRRDDGVPLIYVGKLHSINGEPESGKSWLALLACLQEVRLGRHVIYVDFEDSASSVVGRLRTLALSDEDIGEYFHYLRPEEPVTGHEKRLIDLCQFHAAALVVVDGVTEAMSLHGLSLTNNDDIARFIKALPRVIQHTGAAVVMIDHVTKSKEERGRWAIGGQHKLAAIDGAVYGLTNKSPFVKGAGGVSLVTVQKDRPGGVRPQAFNGVMGRFVLAARADGTAVASLQPPLSEDIPVPPHEKFLDLKDRISEVLLANRFTLTYTKIRDLVGGDKDLFKRAWDDLIAEGGFIEDSRQVPDASGRLVKRDVWGPE